MPRLTPTTQLMKWLKLALMVVPLLTFAATISLWVDTRYMHREVFDVRYLELQIRLIESQMKMYNLTIEDGRTLSVDEQFKYEMDKEQFKNLMKERNRIMGIGNGQ